MADVLIVGGGVIGLSIAWELAGRGLKVQVLEQGEFGREASWAGAGMLPPGNPDYAAGPESLLRAFSHRLWQDWSRQLLADTGIDNGYRNCGSIHLFPDSSTSHQQEIALWRGEGVEVQPLSPAAVCQLEPGVTPDNHGGYRLPEMSQVRNPRHLQALQMACAQLGVELVSSCQVTGWIRHGESIEAVQTLQGRRSAGQFCLAGGAWSQQLLQQLGCNSSVHPVRGQIVQVSCEPLPFQHLLEQGERYLVPRPDGKILIGSTMERVGFVKQNTASAVAGLLEFACSLVPRLAAARFERAWAGLRPGSASGWPYLGNVPGTGNLFAAAGHFRNGLQMSPVTAVLLRQLLLGEPTLFPLDAFALPPVNLDFELPEAR